ncbi:MAG: MarR family winged helix-turn-helix transcriptional regulator [Parvibaculaceae bacterium]
MSLGPKSDYSPPPIEGGNDIQRQFAWTLHDVFRLFQRAWNRRLRDSGIGISPAQSRVLTEVHRQGGQTQTALAETIEMERAPLGRLLDRMEELGFIERKPDPMDRRVRLVFHTEKAEALDEPMWGTARGLFDQALNGVSTEEVELLISILERLKQNLLLEEGASTTPQRTNDE